MCWQSSRFALLLLRPGHSDSDTRTKDSRTQDTRRKDDTETKRLHPQRRSGEQRKFQFWDSMKIYWQRQKCKTLCRWNCVLQLTLGWRLSALMMKKTKGTEQLSALKTNDTQLTQTRVDRDIEGPTWKRETQNDQKILQRDFWPHFPSELVKIIFQGGSRVSSPIYGLAGGLSKKELSHNER